ncbi:hypothetical protein R83H12_00898 [Fibrobacteria bacterium R8-3-H12]
MPISQTPPFTMPSILPPSCSKTCSALVGLRCWNLFALGAASANPASFIISLAICFFGILIATVESPPVVKLGTFSFFGSTIVKGPGQNFSASSLAFFGISAARLSSSSISAICAIKGSKKGLSFTAKILATAFSSKALPASP